MVDPATVGGVFDLGFVQGDVSDLTPDGVLVQQGQGRQRRPHARFDPFPLTLPDGTAKELTVQGVYTEDELAGSTTVNRHLFDGTNVDQYDFGVFMTKADGVSESEAEAAIAAVAAGYPNGKLQSRTEYIDYQAARSTRC